MGVSRWFLALVGVILTTSVEAHEPAECPAIANAFANALTADVAFMHFGGRVQAEVITTTIDPADKKDWDDVMGELETARGTYNNDTVHAGLLALQHLCTDTYPPK